MVWKHVAIKGQLVRDERSRDLGPSCLGCDLRQPNVGELRAGKFSGEKKTNLENLLRVYRRFSSPICQYPFREQFREVGYSILSALVVRNRKIPKPASGIPGGLA